MLNKVLNTLQMKNKYFSYIEPLSVTEREYNNNLGVSKFNSSKKRYVDTVSKYGKIHRQKWSNAWCGRPRMLSVIPKSHLDGNIFRRRRRRMRVRSERLALSLYKIMNIIDEGPIKSKWLRIINCFMKKRYQGIDSIFDIVSKAYSEEHKRVGDLMWLGCKYSPEII